MELILQGKFEQLKICVILPTYNNAGSLDAVLRSVYHYTNYLIVVNDGSTDATEEILTHQPLGIERISYLPNKGKGWALRTGFERAVAMGYDYAITIDTDGQHFAEDLPAFLAKVEETPGCLIIGKRNMEQHGVPGKSSFGNKFSNFWFWFETGYKMEDTQCGYRLYPIKKLASTNYFTRKFEFEIEVIVRAAWSGVPITSVPVKIHYQEKESRISHFRPFRDFTRISILNTLLVIITLLYILPRNFFRKLASRESRNRLRDELFHPNDSKMKKSVSVGFGVFMGILPIWGFQLLVAIALSVVFRLNKALVIIAANISIPPFIPVILFLSMQVGKLYMQQNSVDISFDTSITLNDVRNSFVQYILGAITLSIIAGMFSFICTLALLNIPKRSNPT